MASNQIDGKQFSAIAASSNNLSRTFRQQAGSNGHNFAALRRLTQPFWGNHG